MRNRRTMLFYLPPLAFFILGSFFFLYSRQVLLAEGDREVRAECERIITALEYVQERYVEELSIRDLCFAAMRGIESQLDSYSRFYALDAKKDFDEETEGKFGGIGANVRLIKGFLTIIKVKEGISAHKAGLKPGDQIRFVNGEKFFPLKDGEDDTMLRKIKGPVGTEVVLGIHTRDGQDRDVTLERQEVKIATIESVRVVDPENRIGYIRIRSFSEQTTREFNAAWKELEDHGVKDLIMDLRFNSGGPLRAALDIADRFVSEGVLLFTEGRYRGSTRTFSAHAEGSLPPALGLVILINESSASASEVVAGALQDHKRALLVGARSFGKGVIQSVFSLNREESEILKITTAKYYTPSNRCFDRERGTPEQAPAKPAKERAGEEKRPDAGAKKRPLQRGGIQPDFTVEMDRDQQHRLLRSWSDEGLPEEFQTYENKFSEKREDFKDPHLDMALSLLRGEEIFLPLAGDKTGEKKE